MAFMPDQHWQAAKCFGCSLQTVLGFVEEKKEAGEMRRIKDVRGKKKRNEEKYGGREDEKEIWKKQIGKNKKTRSIGK
ncbi:hypothetical protein LSTR_LSTR015802 [Laodelphax striatellus]|uniref:Uncharacterized protein n=1 Tax=Laodelphax striatellus TaxID=195883 RepID=A0A482WWL4_LAOST|nr:hypothetical protein LSTR_LSTR015802 [Laodelphax striatellus]